MSSKPIVSTLVCLLLILSTLSMLAAPSASASEGATEQAGVIVFEDNFNDDSIDPNLWFTYGRVYERNQRLEFDSIRVPYGPHPGSHPDRDAFVHSIPTFTGPAVLELRFKKGGYVGKCIGLTDQALDNTWVTFKNGASISWGDWGPIAMGIRVDGVDYAQVVEPSFWSRYYNGEYHLTIMRNPDGTFTMKASTEDGSRQWELTTSEKLPLTLPLRVSMFEHVWPGAWWLWERYVDDVVVTGEAPLAVTVDIDPDTLNLRSRGKWITAYIETTGDIDLCSVLLVTPVMETVVIPGEGEVEVPITVYHEDDPKYSFVNNPQIIDRDGDGVPELMVKFDRRELQAALENLRGDVELTVTGQVNGQDFEASDTIRVIMPGRGPGSPGKGKGPQGNGPK